MAVWLTFSGSLDVPRDLDILYHRQWLINSAASRDEIAHTRPA
jgi:hypothetical protein